MLTASHTIAYNPSQGGEAILGGAGAVLRSSLSPPSTVGYMSGWSTAMPASPSSPSNPPQISEPWLGEPCRCCDLTSEKSRTKDN